MSLSVGDYTVSFIVENGNVDGVYVGEALGYPYQDAPTAPCWPIVVRIKGNQMKVKSVWNLD